jgi:hypothetical protein
MDPIETADLALRLLNGPLKPGQQDKANGIMDKVLDAILREFGVAPQEVKSTGGYDGKRKAGK